MDTPQAKNIIRPQGRGVELPLLESTRIVPIGWQNAHLSSSLQRMKGYHLEWKEISSRDTGNL